MGKPIKYIRIQKNILNDDNEFQKFFDQLIKDGLEIIHYIETSITDNGYGSTTSYQVTVVCKKTNEKELL